MDEKDNIKKELEDIAPFLAGLKKENPFKVPANFFEQLPDQIMEQARLTPVERLPPKTSWLDRLIASFAFMLRPQVAFAAICLAALTWTVIFMMQPDQVDQGLANDSFLVDADNYIAANIDEFDTEWLAALAMNDESTDAENTAEEMMIDDLEMDENLIDEILEELEDIELEELL